MQGTTEGVLTEAILEYALDSIMVTDESGRFVRVNPAATRLLGYSREELLEMAVSDVVPGLEQQMGGRQPGLREGEAAVVDKSGQQRQVHFRLVTDVLPGRHLTILQDITEQRQAEGALKRANSRLEQQVVERTGELLEANQRLKQQIKERQAAQLVAQRHSRQVAVLEERQRLARELQDTISQTLWAVAIMVDVLPELLQENPQKGWERLARLRQLIRGTLAEMRVLLLELRPTSLLEFPLEELVEQLVAATANRAQTAVAISISCASQPRADIHLAFYRIVREALDNVVRHARATKIQLDLYCAPNRASVMIKDNGRGFNLEAMQPPHVGLDVMRERAQAIEADLQLSSRPNQGTSVFVEWHSGKGDRQ